MQLPINLTLLLLASMLSCTITLKAQDGVSNPPMFIRSGATVDPTSMKTITWMTNPTDAPQAIMKIAKKSEGESSFVEVRGKTMEYEYDTWYLGSGANPKIPKIAYSVTAEELEPGTTYIYQVGDGIDWSETLEFTTISATNSFLFYVFGDLQATRGDDGKGVSGSTSWLREIAQKYANPATKPLFTIQIGDLVDREHVYNYYKLFGDICDDHPQFANTDMLFAMGNHEYYAGIGGHANPLPDGRGNISKFLNGMPPTNHSKEVGSGTFFVDYGNLRIITLDFVGRDHQAVTGTVKPGDVTAAASINAQAEWLRNNLSNCDKRWKVVSMHYPIYEGPNSQGESFDNPFPAATSTFAPIFEEFGVQFIFAGHTHVDRRIQVRNGVTLQHGHNSNVVPNAPTYITCGNLTSYNSSTTYYRIEVDDDKMVFSNIRNDNGGNTGYSLTVRNWVKSLSVVGANGATEISEPGGTLQMQATVLPEYASNKTVTWSVTTVPAANVARISSSGVLTAVRNGTATVKATANDGSGIESTTIITITGQPIAVTSVTVGGAGGVNEITAPGGTLQMQATVLPENASNHTVEWSITPETGIAEISGSGLLTATANGTVTVRATATDGSNRYGEVNIAISGQIVQVTSVTVAGADGLSSITANGGTLQMIATVLPADATDKTVSWSITPATGVATIGNSGLLTATANGTVTVYATANDDSGEYGEATITVSGQTVTGSEDILFLNLKIYPNPFADALYIAGAEGSTLRLLDAAGAVVHTQKITGANELISLEQLAAGVYFLRIEKDGQTKTEKIVKE